jgi:group I intron endonuclease
MIGIYKITSPTKRIYIGQTSNYNRRISQHKNVVKKTNLVNKLYRSFRKYGFENHLFEFIETCDRHELNNKERYWQDFYKCVSSNGLNSILVNTDILPRFVSNETRRKISESNKGKGYAKGLKRSEDVKLNAKIAYSNRPDNKKMKRVKGNYKMTESHKKNLHINLYSKKSKKVSQINKYGVLVKVWDSAMEIQRELGYRNQNINKCCRDKSGTKTAYGYKWNYA